MVPAPTVVSNPPALERDKTITVLGSSQDTPRLAPYFEVLRRVAERLSGLGYNILTGAATGANYHANLGATPERSYAIHVSGWDSLANQRVNGRPLYRDVAVVPNGMARTAMFNRMSRVLIIAPGGPGSLQEAAVALEAMYYSVPESPERVILLGKSFWKPLIALFDTMIAWGLAKDRLKDRVTVVDVHPRRLNTAVDTITQLITGPQGPLNLLG